MNSKVDALLEQIGRLEKDLAAEFAKRQAILSRIVGNRSFDSKEIDNGSFVLSLAHCHNATWLIDHEAVGIVVENGEGHSYLAC